MAEKMWTTLNSMILMHDGWPIATLMHPDTESKDVIKFIAAACNHYAEFLGQIPDNKRREEEYKQMRLL